MKLIELDLYKHRFTIDARRIVSVLERDIGGVFILMDNGQRLVSSDDYEDVVAKWKA